METRRVLILIASLGVGGAERQALAMARWWTKAGARVRIVCQSDAAPAYAIPESVEVEVLGLAAPSPDPATGLIQTWRRVLAVRSALKAFQPQVAIGMMDGAAALLALARTGSETVFVGAERLSPRFSTLTRPWRLARPGLYGRLDLVVAQTEGAALWLRRHTLAKRVEAIPNIVAAPEIGRLVGVDPVMAGLGDSPLLVTVGRLAVQKRHDRLIEAFIGAAGPERGWRLAILGDGPLKERLRSMGGDWLVMPGAVGNVVQWLKRAQLFALTSDYEGFPNALAEAMACGVAPVAMDCEFGPADLIAHGRSGLLTPAGDLTAFTAALRTAMTDRGLREAMATRATEVVDAFSADRVMAQWEAALAATARSGPPARIPPSIQAAA